MLRKAHTGGGNWLLLLVVVVVLGCIQPNIHRTDFWSLEMAIEEQ